MRSPPTDEPADGDAIRGVFVVGNPHGLHARPAARLVAQVRTHDARVHLTNLTTGNGPVPASSLSRVATLGARQGHQVEVSVTGSQAAEALEQILALAARHFDEHDAPEPARRPAETVGPLVASPGIAIAPACRADARAVVIPDDEPGDATTRWRRLREALAATRRDLARTRARISRETSESDAAIFDAHLMLLDDAELLNEARRRIDSGIGPARAWQEAVTRIEHEFSQLDDSYLRGRAADVRAVGDQVLRHLLGIDAGFGARAGVLIAADLTPAEAAELDAGLVQAVVLAYGSATSHAAILATAKGIPMLVAAGPQVLEIADGTPLVVDGDAGRAARRSGRRRRARLPSSTRRAEPGRGRRPRRGHAARGHDRRRHDRDQREHRLGGRRQGRGRRARRRCGARPHRVPVPVARRTAHGPGTGRDLSGRSPTRSPAGGSCSARWMPVATSRSRSLRSRPKPIRFSASADFDSRCSIRICCANSCGRSAPWPPTHRSASCSRWSARWTSCSPPRRCSTRRVRGHRPDGLRVGIMVEVPAVALKAAAFAPHVDFFSVGTNDLTQYALAAERGNPALAALADPLDPGVLRLIARTVPRQGLPVSVCGEIAADPVAVPLLIGLGVRSLSVAAPAVARVKQAVRELDLGAAVELAQRALTMTGAADVRRASAHLMS